MRLQVFLLLALVLALAVGLVSGLSGAGFWLSVGRAVVALVALQVAYFLFLVFAARGVKRSRPGDNGK